LAINLKLKGKGSCAKKGIAKIGNRRNIETGEMESVYLAVTTKGAGDKTVFKCVEDMKKTFVDEKSVKRSRMATKAEIEEFDKNFPDYDKNYLRRVIEYDTTTDSHNEKLFDNVVLLKFLDIVNSMDFEYDLGEGNTYWDDLEIPKGEYVKVAEWIRDVLKPSEVDISIFNQEMENIALGKPTMAEIEIKQFELKNGNKE
jgi:hypothetical protein